MVGKPKPNAKPPPKTNASRPTKMACHGPAECRGKEQRMCLRLEKEGKCEWAPFKSGRYECRGAAECVGKPGPVCQRMMKQEGKCKWKMITEDDMAPGECVGKRGQPECDDKDRNTCAQLMRERKCIWIKGKKDSKTPKGTCLGVAECENKPRRTCVRMIKQEGKKCRWKPNPANEVKTSLTLKNVKLSKMNKKQQKALKTKLEDTIAKKVPCDDCVNATLSEGSIKVDASIDMEEKFGIMEAESEAEGKPLNLVEEMQSLKSALSEEVGSGETSAEILTAATEVEGVKEAADGEITLDEAKTEVVAESVTQAPMVVEDDAPDPSPAPSPTPTGPEPAPEPAPSPTPSSSSSDSEDENKVVDGTVPQNAFASLVITSVTAMMLQ